MNLQGALSGLMAAAEMAAPLLGGPLGAGAVALIKGVSGTIDNVARDAKMTVPADIQARRTALLAKVQAHAKSTADRLEGNG